MALNNVAFLQYKMQSEVADFTPGAAATWRFRPNNVVWRRQVPLAGKLDETYALFLIPFIIYIIS